MDISADVSLSDQVETMAARALAHWGRGVDIRRVASDLAQTDD